MMKFNHTSDNRTLYNNNNVISIQSGIALIKKVFLFNIMLQFKRFFILKEILHQRYKASVKINAHIKCMYSFII